jgi:hypothetical protein
MASRYSKIRFIGYAIPTTPANLVSIGDPNGPGAVAGSYLADEDDGADIAARIAVLKQAVETAKSKLPADEDPNSVINLFVAPEFYFHGAQGPYLYRNGEADPADTILEQLVAAFPKDEYPNWSLVCGSVISAQSANIDTVYRANATGVRNRVVECLAKQWQASFGPLKGVLFDQLINFIKNCHANPSMEVRNRALLVSNIALDTPFTPLQSDRMTTEKYFVSNEDFLLYETEGRQEVVTEQMTAYPFIDLSAGDIKRDAFDQYAIFRQHYGDDNFPQYVDFAVEICLDHSDVRLRRNIDNEPFPSSGDAVHVQIIPSCGMQIQQQSVAADCNGFVFNCDGQYALDATQGGAETGVFNGVASVYANYVNGKNSGYAAHSQLARIAQPARGGDPNGEGASDASFHPLAAEDICIAAVKPIAHLDDCFAGGAGEVHIYGQTNPYTLYP